MSGKDAFKLLSGIDEELVAEAEDVYAGTDVLTDVDPAERRGHRQMSALAAAACICLFAALVYVTVLLTAGGGWNRIAGAFGWTRETTQESERETDPRTGETVTEGTTNGTESDPNETAPVTDADSSSETGSTHETRTEPETDPDIPWSTARADFFPADAPEDHMETLITQPGTMLRNDDFVFYRDIGWGVAKVNLHTGEKTPVCRDPYCTHWQGLNVSSPEDACPFNTDFGLHFVWGTKIYYVRSYIIPTDTDGAAEYHDVFSSYDYFTGEYKAIEDKKILYNTRTSKTVTPAHESFQYYGDFVVYGSYAYSLQYRPIRGSGDKPEDYCLTLVRLDLTTDKTEDLMSAEGIIPNGSTMCAIRGGVMYFLADDGIWAWNPTETFARHVMVKDPLHERWFRQWNNCIRGGCWYTIMEYSEDGYDFNTKGALSMPVYSVVRIDLKTGKTEKLTDACAEMLFISKDAIYLALQPEYLQTEEAWIASASPWYSTSENQHQRLLRAVVRMDLDGGNAEILGWCKPGATPILLDNGLIWDGGYFEFSTGITYNRDGTVRDDPKNGVFQKTAEGDVSFLYPSEDYDWHYPMNP